MNAYAIVAIVAYLLGSIPFGYILVRLFLKQDIRATGSGNIGATNVARAGKKGLAIATLVLDALKGTAAVLVAKQVFANAPEGDRQLAVVAAALIAIAGHVFPAWLRFQGGKGVATGVGVFAALAPKAILVVLLLFLAVVAITRYVSLGSIVAAAVFPVMAWWLDGYRSSPAVIWIMCAASALIIVKHHQNIARLMKGTENRFGSKKSSAPPVAENGNA